MSKYTFIRFVTSYSKGSLIGWSGEGGGGVTLNKKIPLNGRVALGRGLVF